ncbi:PREDICTED: protein MEMO1 isoform X2 [Ceratosolen solmsi marchali]|uniref:Protein MEMO1 isoform X2 n=1 Tax=Ceratosolen solmsi marchali TaxID=326594 RepID=A0AAJ6YEZ9_9HYME|nr:PREDICTED: protein MEMO1 isoform X2 [Ceratosolen solmsi marchali]
MLLIYLMDQPEQLYHPMLVTVTVELVPHMHIVKSVQLQYLLLCSRKIFILGPSHHGASRCSLTLATTYKTPLYDLKIDAQVCQELIYTEKFNWLSMDKDEEEHSIEMQLPYIAKVMEGYQDSFTIIPILIGSLTPAEEAEYGKILAPYMANPQNLFVISSDFCHWGQRFRYTYYDKSYGPIYNSIKNLDQMGMDIIEKLTPSLFTEYLKKYENTICGRHPIGILLQTIQSIKNSGNAQRMTLKFLKYAQSSQCNNMNDSSVSYASASLVIE